MVINQVLNIIDNKAYEKAVLDYTSNGKVLALDNSMFEIEPIELPPYPGLKLEKSFPNCCVYHQSIFEAAVHRLHLFPDCCEFHAPLKGQKWFKKEKYMDFPARLLNTLVNTETCIELNIKKDEWYKLITDYLDLAILSLGQFPKGFGSPLGFGLFTENIKEWMETQNFIPKERRKAIGKYIDDKANGKESKEGFNLIQLLNIYDTWLKLFPFELPFFRPLKEHFFKTRPVIKGSVEVNSFTGMSKGNLFGTADFCDFLKNTTQSLLAEIKTPDLIKEYSLDEAQVLEFEMVKQQHTIRQKKLLSSIIKLNDFGIETIQKWLDNEKSFIGEFVSFIKTKNKRKEFSQMEPIVHPIPFFTAYLNEIQTLDVKVLEKYFTSDGPISHLDPKLMPNYPFKKGFFLSLEHCCQSKSNYAAEIARLQEKAANEVILLHSSQIQLMINRVNEKLDNFNLFWKKYAELIELHQSGKLNRVDLEILIYPFFIVENQRFGQITKDFIFHIHDAAMIKEGSLLKMRSSLRKAIGTHDESHINKEAKNESVDYLTIETEVNISEEKLEDTFLPVYRPYFKDFVRVLLLADRPPVDDEGKLLPKPQKNLFVVWLDVLITKRIVSIGALSDEKKAKLLMAQFADLRISGSSMRQTNKRAEEFRKSFESEILNLKANIHNQKV